MGPRRRCVELGRFRLAAYGREATVGPERSCPRVLERLRAGRGDGRHGGQHGGKEGPTQGA